MISNQEQAKLAFPCSFQKMPIRRHVDRRRRLIVGVHIVLTTTLFALAPGTPAPSDMIYTGGNLTDGDTLVSAGGSFTLGFFSLPEEPTKRYLGTWFSFSSPSPDAMAIYWVANRDRPLAAGAAASAGVLLLTANGTLLLLDGSSNDRVVWSSDSTSSTRPTGARLLESGNLVVVSNGSTAAAAAAQWQSFDHPCNALLPGMKIGQNLWSGDAWYLSSWRSAADPGTGSYRYITELGGGTPENVMRDAGANGTKTYRTGPWNGERFDGVPEMASYASNFSYQVTISPSEATYGYTAKPGAPFSQLRLGDAGVVQRLVWDDGRRQWNSFLKEPRDDCDGYAHCGPFGLCDRDNADTSLCSCFSGFVPAAPKEWSLREFSGGCRRNVSLDCGGGGGGGGGNNQSRSSSSTDGFLVVPSAKLPDTQNATVDMDISLDACRLRCLANCSCVAYAAADVTTGGGDGGSSGCIIWTDSFTDLRYIEKGQDFYLRLPKSLLGQKKKKKVAVKIVVLAVVGGVVLLVVVVIFGIVCWRRRVTLSRPGEDAPPAGHSIQYKILKDATNNFSKQKKIGQGSFGTVYQCELPPSESTRIGLAVGVNKVAVKVLNQSDNNFERELRVLFGLSHVNLVRLFAFCKNDGGYYNLFRLLPCCKRRPLLIYEYMENGSLDRYIFGEENERKKLDWTKRLKIITSIANGVYYLHVDSNRSIIHRDLKPANILLADDFLTPKIADFGLAKHVPDQPAVHTVVGPLVYSAPECRRGETTKKSDVYSFGVVLLEIISGNQNCVAFMQRLLPKERNLWKNANNDEALEKFLDPKVTLSPEENEDPKFLSRLWRCIQIGLLCVQESPDNRPDISMVVELLTTEGELPELKEPALREEGETSNTRPELEEPAIREECETSNTRPGSEEPALREEGETSNTRWEPEESTIREEGETSNIRPEPEQPTIKEEGETSNTRPEPKEPAIREEDETSNTRPKPEEPALREEGETSNTRPEPKVPTLREEVETSNTRPKPEEPALREIVETSNTRRTDDDIEQNQQL